MAPVIPSAPSVRTISAPYAFRIFLRSTLIVSGIVRISRYPSAAAIEASPIPVLPEVGSINTAPSFKRPRSLASRIIAFAIRSFTLPAGLRYSSFNKIRTSRPNPLSRFPASRSGVLPTSSNTLSKILIQNPPFLSGHVPIYDLNSLISYFLYRNYMKNKALCQGIS